MPRLLLLALLFLAPLGAAAATPEEEVQHYLAVFQSNGDISQAVEELGWKGISDTRLFDVIEARALEELGASGRSREERNHAAYHVRALAFSGQAKYATTILAFSRQRMYRKQAERAMRDFPLYAKWNPVISDRATFDPKFSDDTNRVLNMLRAPDMLLKRLGAKRAYLDSKDEIVFSVLAEQLQASYKTTNSDREVQDSIAWMLKALERYGSPKFDPLVREVTHWRYCRYDSQRPDCRRY